jgi:hypothetical protein
MKGRKRHYERPVYKNIALESWVVDILDESKKFGIRPNEIIEAGLISILKSSDKMPLSLLRSFVNSIQPKVKDFVDTLDYFEKLIQRLESQPSITQQKLELAETQPRIPKWFDDFHAVKFLETGDFILIEKTAYLEQPSLFEIQDENVNLDWKKLPRYYAIEAVMKVHSQNGSPIKGDAPA